MNKIPDLDEWLIYTGQMQPKQQEYLFKKEIIEEYQQKNMPKRVYIQRISYKEMKKQFNIPQKIPILDLHGYNLHQAEHIFRLFLQEYHQKGYRTVQIITGKGKNNDSIIRHNFFKWLEEFVHIVHSYASAASNQGGEGAYYLMLRRKNE